MRYRTTGRIITDGMSARDAARLHAFLAVMGSSRRATIASQATEPTARPSRKRGRRT